jgi:hypothetical protein
MVDNLDTSENKIPIRKTFSVRRRKTWMFLPVLLLTIGCIMGMLWPMAGAAVAQGEKPSKQPPSESDVQRLAGRWVRPDGGYILELSEAHEGGSLKAAYFNPRPIKVFQAVWARQGGKITVMVELRDVNYPGSTYNLEYDAKSDRLKGTYFQALERQTFDIQFMRAR